MSLLPCRAKELISLTSGLLLSFFLYISDNCTTHCPSLKVMWFFSFFQPRLRTLVQHRKPMTHEGTGQSVVDCLQHVVRFCPQPREKNPESFDSKRGTKRWRVRTPQTLSTVCRRIHGKTKLRILMLVEKSWQMKSNSVGRCNNRGILFNWRQSILCIMHLRFSSNAKIALDLEASRFLGECKCLAVETADATGHDLHWLIPKKVSDLFSCFMTGLQEMQIVSRVHREIKTDAKRFGLILLRPRRPRRPRLVLASRNRV